MHERKGLFLETAKSSPDSDVHLGIFRRDDLIIAQVQCPGKLLAKLGQEGKRPAQEADRSTDGTAAGKTGDGLQDDGLEHGSRYIFFAGPVIQEGLYVCFGEYTAAGCNRIQRI